MAPDLSFTIISIFAIRSKFPLEYKEALMQPIGTNPIVPQFIPNDHDKPFDLYTFIEDCRAASYH